jgi:hypothetical protein
VVCVGLAYSRLCAPAAALFYHLLRSVGGPAEGARGKLDLRCVADDGATERDVASRLVDAVAVGEVSPAVGCATGGSRDL